MWVRIIAALAVVGVLGAGYAAHALDGQVKQLRAENAQLTSTLAKREAGMDLAMKDLQEARK
jgi:hypothetical protein